MEMEEKPSQQAGRLFANLVTAGYWAVYDNDVNGVRYFPEGTQPSDIRAASEPFVDPTVDRPADYLLPIHLL
jgi:hypothetical protein